MSVRETATRFVDACGASSVSAPLGTNGSSRSKCAGKREKLASAAGRNGTGKSGARTGKQNASLHSAAFTGNSPIDGTVVHSAQKGKATQSKSGSKGKQAAGKTASSIKATSPLAVTGEETAAARVRKKPPIIASKKLKKEKIIPPVQQDSSSQFDQFTSGLDRQPSAFTQSNYQVGQELQIQVVQVDEGVRSLGQALEFSEQESCHTRLPQFVLCNKFLSFRTSELSDYTDPVQHCRPENASERTKKKKLATPVLRFMVPI